MLVELAYGLGAGAVSVGLAAAVVRLWKATFSVPISYSGDAMLVLSVARNMQVSGSYLHADQLGAPFGQDLAAFPGSVGDLWHLGALRLLTLVLSPAESYNVFLVASFVGVALTSYVAFRWLGTRQLLAATLAVVYSVASYHFARAGGHLFLSAYFSVPLGVAMAVHLLRGRVDLLRPPRRFGRDEWLSVGAIVLLVGGGVYYAAFCALLLLTAGTLRALAERRWRPLLNGIGAVGALVLGIAATALPYLVYDPPVGSSTPVQGRTYGAAETFGLKIVDLVLPLPAHRIDLLRHFRAVTDTQGIRGEGTETLGMLATLGLLAVVIALLVPRVRPAGEALERLRAHGTLAVVMILCSTIAGFGGLLAVLGFGMLRAWNRASIVIAFSALCGVAVILELLWARLRPRLPARPRFLVPATAVLLSGGLVLAATFDQTGDQFLPDYPRTAQQWDRDGRYFAGLEARYGTGASVFQLPVTSFPENGAVGAMPDYDHLRGYLHSDLAWSYGGVKGGPAQWQQVAFADGVEAALPRLVAAGFDALYVNRAAYPDRGAEIESAIVAVTGPQAPAVDEAGELATYDLRAYGERLRSEGAVPDRDEVLHPVHVETGEGFYAPEELDGERFQWAGSLAEAQIIVPLSQPTRVRLTGEVRLPTADGMLRVTVDGVDSYFVAVDHVVELDMPLTLDPGATNLGFATNSDAEVVEGDGRDLRQQFVGLTVTRNG
ncbi:hypothetical protein CSO01_00570 [Cellulomonas soli]|uniref:Glycosyltransferase RgtA/B/C/D-like domain-containing protein n=1 Tax=Cellulomonas soli TaxID=931535 RepID=A0A512P890_9CELL|nr:hypothetical protein CSO01_00570 [Cellulomonas soli]